MTSLVLMKLRWFRQQRRRNIFLVEFSILSLSHVRSFSLLFPRLNGVNPYKRVTQMTECALKHSKYPKKKNAHMETQSRDVKCFTDLNEKSLIAFIVLTEQCRWCSIIIRVVFSLSLSSSTEDEYASISNPKNWISNNLQALSSTD